MPEAKHEDREPAVDVLANVRHEELVTHFEEEECGVAVRTDEVGAVPTEALDLSLGQTELVEVARDTAIDLGKLSVLGKFQDLHPHFLGRLSRNVGAPAFEIGVDVADKNVCGFGQSFRAGGGGDGGDGKIFEENFLHTTLSPCPCFNKWYQTAQPPKLVSINSINVCVQKI